MKNIKKHDNIGGFFFSKLVLLVLLVSFATVPAFAQRGTGVSGVSTIDIRLASPLIRETPIGRALEEAALEIARISNNAVRLIILHGGREGDSGRTASSLIANSLQAAWYNGVELYDLMQESNIRQNVHLIQEDDNLELAMTPMGILLNNVTWERIPENLRPQIRDVLRRATLHEILFNTTALENGAARIDIYGGITKSRVIRIPSQIQGRTVTEIGSEAFHSYRFNFGFGFGSYDRSSEITITGIMIPYSVTSIGDRAFGGNQITNIVIGANVNMSSSAFRNRFVDFYNEQGRRAGTYTLSNGSWRRQ